MTFKITHKDKKARVGQLTIDNKTIETPFFMPALTKGTGKLITTDDYNEINTPNIIANALLLSFRPGIETIKKAGGLHKFINYQSIIFTDCGGFQMSRGVFLKKSKKGLHFRNPYNESKVVITPKRMMEIQLTLNSDVAMMLDDMSGYEVSKEEAKKAMENTNRWGLESLKAHQELKGDSKQLLFGIVQGNFYPDLRKESAKFIAKQDFDGIAIGGVAIGEPKEEMHKAVSAAIKHLPENKPRYVMGVGSPLEILDLVEKGIDCFDSVYPTQLARHSQMFTFSGKVIIDKQIYANDFTPIEKNCNCHTCKTYTRAYIHHLTKVGEPSAKRFKSIHNAYFMQRFMERIQEAIKEKKFKEFKEEFRKNWKKQII